MPFKNKEYEKQYKKERYLKNRESILAYAKARREDKEKYSKDRIKITEWMLNNPQLKLLNQARARAKRNGIAFNIEASDIEIPIVCPYLGVPLTNILGDGKQPFNPSIDRIDNSKGYVKGNVRVISHLANSMKRDATLDQLVGFAKGVLKLHSLE